MKATYAPVLAASMMLGLGVALLPALAQLPPTNMGKYVHTPGDNQYSPQTQMTRHGAPAPPPAARAAVPSGGWAPTPPPKKPDITLEPIACDEPIPPAGFPPLPDRLDLPVGNQGAWNRAASGGGGYGGGDGGGAAPGVAGGGGGAITPTFHQHYGHVPPGAFQQQKSGSGYYKAIDPGMPARQGAGYYKARSPGSDYFNANPGTGGAPGMQPPAYTGASPSALKSLGREPKLNERNEQTQTPDAPTPVVVSQSSTQDLSLPEDEFSYRHPGKSGGFGKTAGRMIKGPLNSVGGVAGVRF